MSYCRFENTKNDLRDCLDHIDDTLEEGGYEAKARIELIRLAFAIVEPFLINDRDLDDMQIRLDMGAVMELPVSDED